MKRLDVRNPIPRFPEQLLTYEQDIIVVGNSEFLTLFVDLLKKIFVYDPDRRIKAKQALQHPWFKLVCTPDDGTEAVKIRLEQMQRERAAERSIREGQRLAPIHVP
jgi:serine/threonine protein kinase